jgi:xylulokinase
VRTASTSEGPALGVAILAGVGAGLYPDVRSACRKMIQYGDALGPNEAAQSAYANGYKAYRALYPALKDCFSLIKSL